MQMKLKTCVVFTEAVNKSVRDAISSHDEAFLDTFHNTMKEVFHEFPDQMVLAYYNILAIKKQHQLVIMTSR